MNVVSPIAIDQKDSARKWEKEEIELNSVIEHVNNDVIMDQQLLDDIKLKMDQFGLDDQN